MGVYQKNGDSVRKNDITYWSVLGYRLWFAILQGNTFRAITLYISVATNNQQRRANYNGTIIRKGHPPNDLYRREQEEGKRQPRSCGG